MRIDLRISAHRVMLKGISLKSSEPLVFFLCLWCSVLFLESQTPATKPKFDVVSVKPSKTASEIGAGIRVQANGGRLIANNATVKIARASRICRRYWIISEPDDWGLGLDRIRPIRCGGPSRRRWPHHFAAANMADGSVAARRSFPAQNASRDAGTTGVQPCCRQERLETHQI
jgi:hypothetical protein